MTPESGQTQQTKPQQIRVTFAGGATPERYFDFMCAALHWLGHNVPRLEDLRFEADTNQIRFYAQGETEPSITLDQLD